MRKNILLVCYDYALAKRIANVISEKTDMRSFDMYEMFKFNNYPSTLDEMLTINGKDFVDKEMRGVLKSELDFIGVIFVADMKILISNQDLFDSIKETNKIIYLKSDFKTEYSKRENINYISQIEKEYFSLKLDELNESEHIISKDLADKIIDIDELTYVEIIDKVMDFVDKEI